MSDSYKFTHHNMYPKNTKGVYSYFEAREGAEYDATVFFGLQYLLKRYMVGPVIKASDVLEAEKLSAAHFGDPKLFNKKGWDHIVHDHNGRLPLKIKAVPEGLRIPNSNVLMTVENTCDECYWLTNFFESLLVHTWYPSTVATRSTDTIQMIGDFLEASTGTREGAEFMLHDFGYRGASSHESAAIGGAAHLISSMGTDTVAGMALLAEYYGAPLENLAFSVPATEHSMMTARGEDGEMDVFAELLKEYPNGILSVVSDSYNIDLFVENAASSYEEVILARNGKVVFRPDSLRNKDDTPAKQMVYLSQLLDDVIGKTEVNAQGYRVLDPHVGLLWGDGISPKDIEDILEATAEAGYAASNYVFGMGGGLLQKVNRDTQRFAFKASAIKEPDHEGDPVWIPVHKGAHGKGSKSDRLKLHRIHPVWDKDKQLSTYETQKEWIAPHDHVEVDDVLELVFENGELKRDMTFEEVRKNARKASSDKEG